MTQNDQQEAPLEQSAQHFVSTYVWEPDRPRILIVACSDGRYQQCLDEFLNDHLGISRYDRLYAAGGPGALASSTLSYFRGEQFRQESAFLVDAHDLEEVIFIFHGPMLNEGPQVAACADYLRKMPGASIAEIFKQQEADLSEAIKAVVRVRQQIRVRAFRAEVTADRHVQFVPVQPAAASW